jgi:putative iron-dependent peroxidase
MSSYQPGILADETPLARYLTFALKPGSEPGAVLQRLRDNIDGSAEVIGLGGPLLRQLGCSIDGMKTFTAHAGPGFSVPATPAALWLWLRGNDRGELLHRSRKLTALLADAFEISQVIDAFQYRGNRDLTGYEDGTENPEGDDAIATAFVQGKGQGLDGSSFVAVQQWVHDLDRFQAMPPSQQDHTFGRRISDNEEIEDAPLSAHVKRTAQEDFEPEAFVLRRSMPWADTERSGLVFVAFGHSLEAFEALLQRMTGEDDGIVDALFSFTHPVTGSYFWCPPLSGDDIDLSAIGL